MKTRETKDSFEAKLERIRNAIRQHFSGEQDMGVVSTFKDAAIISNYTSDEFYEIPYATGANGEILLGEPRPVAQLYVTKKLTAENPRITMTEATELIASFNDSAGESFIDETLAKKTNIDNPEALHALIHYQATGLWPGEKAQTDRKEVQDSELTGPIVKKNAAKRIAYAAVLVPGEIDHDGESVTKEKTEQAAHEWMELYQNVDLQHTLNNVGTPVESYLLPMEMTVKAVHGQQAMTLPEGTWILGSRLDEPTWAAVEKGELTGYSIMGMKRAAMKSNEPALKKTLLRDLGPDWVPTHVSVVNEPAVPKAKFFALKAQGGEHTDALPEKDTTVLGRIKAAIDNIKTNQAEKEGRRFSKTTVEKLKTAAEAIMKLVAEAEAEEENKSSDQSQKGGTTDMTPEEIKEMIATAIKEVTEPLTAKLDEIETAMKEAAAKAEEAAKAKGPEDEEEEGSEFEAFKAEVTGMIEGLAKRLGGTRATALKGQDGDDDDPAKKSAPADRDPYGRKLKSV